MLVINLERTGTYLSRSAKLPYWQVLSEERQIEYQLELMPLTMLMA